MVTLVAALLTMGVVSDSAGMNHPGPAESAAIRLAEWLGSEWGEYEDIFEAWELHELSTGEARAPVSVVAAAAAPGVDLADAWKTAGGIVPVPTRTKPERPRVKPWRATLTGRADRRFGERDRENSRRWDGAPFGITQRFYFSTVGWRAGAVLNKNRYEPSVGDLYRVAVEYGGERLSLTGGDFTFCAGLGTALWTKPVYYYSLDSPGAYRRWGAGAAPALDTRENSPFRGAALQWRNRTTELQLFAAATRLDATVNDSGMVQRLSADGFHRSVAEARKNDTVSEQAAGGMVNVIPLQSGRMQLTLTAAGFAADYAPPFRPDPDTRRPYQFTGGDGGVAGLSAALAAPRTLLAAEVAGDAAGGRAWQAVLLAERGVRRRVNVNFALFDFPPDYHGLRAFGSSGGPDPADRRGGGMMVRVKPVVRPLQSLTAHLDVLRHNSRTFTVPAPSLSTRASLRAELDLEGLGPAELRLRLGTSPDPSGGEGEIATVATRRMRLTWRPTALGERVPGRLTLAYATETGGGVKRRGGLVGAAVGPVPGAAKGALSRLRLSGSTYYITGLESPRFYLAESDFPGRLGCVGLSGEQLRWRGSLVWRFKNGWLGWQAAQTLWGGTGTGDVEVYVSVRIQVSGGG